MEWVNFDARTSRNVSGQVQRARLPGTLLAVNQNGDASSKLKHPHLLSRSTTGSDAELSPCQQSLLCNRLYLNSSATQYLAGI